MTETPTLRAAASAGTPEPGRPLLHYTAKDMSWGHATSFRPATCRSPRHRVPGLRDPAGGLTWVRKRPPRLRV